MIHRCHKKEFLLRFARDRSPFRIHESTVQTCPADGPAPQTGSSTGGFEVNPEPLNTEPVNRYRFIEATKERLGIRAKGRKVFRNNGAY